MLPRSSPEKHLVTDHSKGEEVCFGGVKCSFKSLGSHIGRCPDVELPDEVLFPDEGEAKIADFPGGSRFEDVGRFQVSMDDFHFEEIFVARHDLLHDADGDALTQPLVLFNK